MAGADTDACQGVEVEVTIANAFGATVAMKRLIPIALLLALAASPAQADASSQRDGKYWVSALRDSARRDEAVCALILRGEVVGDHKYRETVPDIGCKVTGTFDNSTQSDGVVGVFLGSPWSETKLADGQAGGHLLMFDAAGRGVPAFEGSNSLGETDGVVSYRPSGEIAVVQQISYGGPFDRDVDGIYVVPATTGQVPILSVLVATPKKKEGAPAPAAWSWRALDLDGDGTLEIQIGRVVRGKLTPEAVYHYSAVSQRFEGPGGSPTGDFYLLPSRPEKRRWEMAKEMSHAGLRIASEPSPSSGSSVAEKLEILHARFTAAREAGDYELADTMVLAMAQLMGRRFLSRYTDEIASYWIFERGHCNLKFLPQDKIELFLRHERELREGIQVCEAAKLPADAGEEVKRRMTQLIDSRVEVGGYRRTDVYDQFARQRTINERALELLSAYDLQDVRFERGDESALIEQIRAGRAENVRSLLDAGYDVNLGTPRIWQHTQVSEPDTAPFQPPPVLPLQAVKDSLAVRGEQALEVAKVLLERGANPHRLKWASRYTREVAADPVLEARLDAMFAEAAKSHNAISSEFRGFLVESFPDDGESVYARFEVGNGSDETFALRAWTDSGDYLLGSLNMESHFETRLVGGAKWDSPLSIEHGWSPSTSVQIKPGESRIVLYPLGSYQYLQGPEGLRHRLWINNYPGAIYSEPFRMSDPRYPVIGQHRAAKRDWYGERQREERRRR